MINFISWNVHIFSTWLYGQWSKASFHSWSKFLSDWHALFLQVSIDLTSNHQIFTAENWAIFFLWPINPDLTENKNGSLEKFQKIVKMPLLLNFEENFSTLYESCIMKKKSVYFMTYCVLDYLFAVDSKAGLIGTYFQHTFKPNFFNTNSFNTRFLKHSFNTAFFHVFLTQLF